MRGKIVYPVHDESGRVLTFFGRYPGGSASGDPEVIHKVRHLFFSF